MAGADRQPARKLAYLEVVTTALRRLGLSEESIKRGIFRGCGDGSLPYEYTGEAPPAGFWRNPNNAKLTASDISNTLLLPADAGAIGFYTFTLRDVMLDWEHVVAMYPALRGTEPPELGISRTVVSLATPLMKWFERLWRRPAPSAEERPVASATEEKRVAKKLWKKSEAVAWLFEQIDKYPPPTTPGEKLNWARQRLGDMKVDFDGNHPWKEADTIRHRLDDVLSGRLRRPDKKK